MILLDTNLLVYAHRSGTPEHRAAQNAIERACNSAAVMIAGPTVAEFFCVVTHPRCTPRPSTATEASAFIHALEESGKIRFCLPNGDFHARLLQLASDLNVHGPRIFDVQIALTGRDNGARQIWTRDKNFQSIPGMTVLDPL